MNDKRTTTHTILLMAEITRDVLLQMCETDTNVAPGPSSLIEHTIMTDLKSKIMETSRAS